MGEWYSDIVDAVTKALESNKVVKTDRERLKKAERLGPGCVREMGK